MELKTVFQHGQINPLNIRLEYIVFVYQNKTKITSDEVVDNQSLYR